MKTGVPTSNFSPLTSQMCRGGLPRPPGALVLLAGGIIASGLALYLFNWDRRNNSRRGHPALAALALLPYILGALLLV
ncbi:MAG TPA: hypothetical protein PKL00_04205 [Bacillota bacterium]|jgi:hypothetical protein|nr:hypothetical protein [Bacillota bacterium]